MCLTLVLLEQRVVDRQHRAAGIAEQVLDALVLQRLDDHLGAGHLSCSGLHLVSPASGFGPADLAVPSG